VASGGGREMEVEEVCLFGKYKCDVSKTCLSLRTQRLLWLAKPSPVSISGHRNWAKLETWFYICRGEATDQCVKQHKFWTSSLVPLKTN
jgi:hypothetical protein